MFHRESSFISSSLFSRTASKDQTRIIHHVTPSTHFTDFPRTSPIRTRRRPSLTAPRSQRTNPDSTVIPPKRRLPANWRLVKRLYKPFVEPSDQAHDQTEANHNPHETDNDVHYKLSKTTTAFCSVLLVNLSASFLACSAVPSNNSRWKEPQRICQRILSPGVKTCVSPMPKSRINHVPG